MKLLLDTHAFLWWSLEPEKLPEAVLRLLKDPANEVFFSAASAWEAQIKAGLGRLLLADSLETVVRRELTVNGWTVLPVTLAHVWKLTEIPPFHNDPFDRILIAQALEGQLTIVGRDPLFSLYADVTTVWG